MEIVGNQGSQELSWTWRQLVHDYCQKNDLRYSVYGESLGLPFAGPDDRKVNIVIFLDGDFLVIRTNDDRYVDPEKSAIALAACNRWNAEYKMPKMYLNVREEEEKSDLVGEWFIPASFAVNDESFAEFLDFVISAALQTFSWMGENYEL